MRSCEYNLQEKLTMSRHHLHMRLPRQHWCTSSPYQQRQYFLDIHITYPPASQECSCKCFLGELFDMLYISLHELALPSNHLKCVRYWDWVEKYSVASFIIVLHILYLRIAPKIVFSLRCYLQLTRQHRRNQHQLSLTHTSLKQKNSNANPISRMLLQTNHLTPKGDDCNLPPECQAIGIPALPNLTFETWGGSQEKDWKL